MVSSAKASLKHLKVRPSKKRGQHFVIEDSVLSTIVDFGRPTPDDHLLEIGPGLGALTERLCAVAPLTVIEIEARFCEELTRRFPQVRVINEDIRRTNLTELGGDLVVFGNLPYIFSTEIIFHLLAHAKSVRRAVLLLQREFAERLAAAPNTRAYGTISVNCQIRADVVLGPIIPGNSFHPPTEVESRLVELRMLAEPRYGAGNTDWVSKVVRASFLKRRKKIVNSLLASGILGREQIEAALKKAGIDGGRRAETLSVEEFVYFAHVCAL